MGRPRAQGDVFIMPSRVRVNKETDGEELYNVIRSFHNCGQDKFKEIISKLIATNNRLDFYNSSSIDEDEEMSELLNDFLL